MKPDSKPTGALAVELACVPEFLQDRIVPGRFEKSQRAPEDLVQERRRVQHVKIEREQVATQMELRLVVERAAPIALEALLDRPGEDVAQRVEIEMKIERDAVIEAEVVVIDDAVVHQGDAERHRLSVLAPDKKPRPIRHSLSETAEIVLGQALEL